MRLAKREKCSVFLSYARVLTLDVGLSLGSITRAFDEYWALCFAVDSAARAQRLADRLSGQLAALAADSGCRAGWWVDARLQALIQCKPDLRRGAPTGSAATEAGTSCFESRAGAFCPTGTPDPRDVRFPQNTGPAVCPLPSRDWTVPGPAPACCTSAFDKNWFTALLAFNVLLSQEELAKGFMRPSLAEGVHGCSRVILPGSLVCARRVRGGLGRLTLQEFAEWVLAGPRMALLQMLAALDRFPDVLRFTLALLAASRRGRSKLGGGDALPARLQVPVVRGELRLAC